MRTEIAEDRRRRPARDEPLTYYHELDKNLYSATSKTFIGQLYDHARHEEHRRRGRQAASGYPQLSAEYVIKADPDLIFLADTKCCAQSARDGRGQRPGWDQLTAVRSGGVVELDDDVASRWGPRVVDFLKVVRGQGPGAGGGWPVTRGGLLAAGCAGLAGAALAAVCWSGPVPLNPGAVLVELAGRLPLVTTHSGLSQQEAAILWSCGCPGWSSAGSSGPCWPWPGRPTRGSSATPWPTRTCWGRPPGPAWGPPWPSPTAPTPPPGRSTCYRWPPSPGPSSASWPPTPSGARAGPGRPPP